MKKLKQILSNKNTVTILGVILIVIVLYIFYNWRLNEAVSPIRIPYAIQTIGPRTEITSDMIGYLDITKSALKGDVLTNVNTQILGMYTNVNYTIPFGSLFYANALVEKRQLPDAFLIDIEEGHIAYNFDVSMKSTYGNSMYPGNYVDIYFKGVDDTGLVMVGKLVENVKILAVKDSAGHAVFENTTEERSPSQIIFSVTENIHLLLRKAEYIKGVEIILVPTNASLDLDEGENAVITITSEAAKQYIESKSITVD